MTKWEYNVVRTTKDNIFTRDNLDLVVDKPDEQLKGHTLDAAFNILGEQGWGLPGESMPTHEASIYPWFVVFKRPLG